MSKAAVGVICGLGIRGYALALTAMADLIEESRMMSVPFDPASVRALATILADTGLTEIEIEGKDGRIRVVRAPAPVMATVARHRRRLCRPRRRPRRRRGRRRRRTTMRATRARC